VKRQGPIELIVKRGALRRFQILTEKTGALPVKVSWDRRASDRRTSSTKVATDQRKADRRQPPPFTWDMADFVIVARSNGRARKKRATAKKK
jgi:hypothetical protein